MIVLYMADPNMTSVNIPKPLHKKLKLLRKKTRLAVGVMAELAIEEYIQSALTQSKQIPGKEVTI